MKGVSLMPLNKRLKSISRMKVLCVVACTALLWVLHITFLVSLPVSVEINAEKTIAGSLRLASAFTRGQGQWHRIFVGETQLVCSPSGYNACDMSALIAAQGKMVTGTYVEERATLLQPIRLIVELATDHKALLRRDVMTHRKLHRLCG